MDKPTILILAGGENSRFFPLNTTTHKGALTLLGKPMIVLTLENLENNGFKHVVLIVSKKDYDGQGLSGFLAEYNFKLKIDYVLQPEAKGMGHALLQAREYLNGPFGIIYPSSLDAGDLVPKLIHGSGKGGALLVTYTQEPWLYGIVTLDQKRITSITEKPQRGSELSNLMAQGMYYLYPAFLDFLENVLQEEYSFEVALSNYFSEHEVNAVEEANPCPQLKYTWHLFDFQEILFKQLHQYISPYAKIAKTAVLDSSNGPIYIENGATIGHAAKIVGPAYIGKDVFIGDFSLIRHSSFEEGSSVGVYSDVTRSIIMEDSSMHNGFIGDSIIGRDVQIGAGLITSNKRIDRKNVLVTLKENVIDSGREGLGTVIGDHARIGIRVNIMPGKLIGAEAFIYPTSTVYSNVKKQGVLKVKYIVDVE